MLKRLWQRTPKETDSHSVAEAKAIEPAPQPRHKSEKSKLPAGAILLNDGSGRYFLPNNPRTEPKRSAPQHPQFHSFSELSDEDAVAALIATSAAARTRPPNPAAMPTEAPPIQYGGPQ